MAAARSGGTAALHGDARITERVRGLRDASITLSGTLTDSGAEWAREVEAEAASRADDRRCIFVGCVSTDRHWHGGFPGGYGNPADPDGPPIPFTTEPEPGVRDYNGALLER